MANRKLSTLILWLSLLGIACAAYLVYQHLGLMRGQLLGGFGCGSQGYANCYAVTGSRWGMFLGAPLALWGLLAYMVIFALSLLARQSAYWAEHAFRILLLVALLAVLVDLYLLYLMLFVIHHICIYCLATYGVNLGILVLAWLGTAQLSGGRFGALGHSFAALIPSVQHPELGFFWGIVLLGVFSLAGFHTGVMFTRNGTLKSIRPRVEEYVSQQQRVVVNTQGRPTKGDSASLHLVEFSDFLCPVCLRAAKISTIIEANHRKDMAFTFKHYPLDNSCNSQMPRAVHAGACKLAEAAECAFRQGRFWEVHDLFFAKEDVYAVKNLEQDLAGLGLDMEQFDACVASGEAMEVVKQDIAEAGRLQVTSTPTFFLNGVTVRGVIQPETFEYFAEALRN